MIAHNIILYIVYNIMLFCTNANSALKLHSRIAHTKLPICLLPM